MRWCRPVRVGLLRGGVLLAAAAAVAWLAPTAPGLVLAAGLAGLALAQLLRALLRLPAVRVDESGIRTSWTRGAAGLVGWDEVTRIRRDGRVVVVGVHHPADVVRRAPRWRRRHLLRLVVDHGSPVVIDHHVLGADPTAHLIRLHHWRNHVAWSRDRAARS